MSDEITSDPINVRVPADEPKDVDVRISIWRIAADVAILATFLTSAILLVAYFCGWAPLVNLNAQLVGEQERKPPSEEAKLLISSLENDPWRPWYAYDKSVTRFIGGNTIFVSGMNVQTVYTADATIYFSDDDRHWIKAAAFKCYDRIASQIEGTRTEREKQEKDNLIRSLRK